MENKKTGLRMDCGCNLYTGLLPYNEIYARIVHPLPRAAEKGEQDVFNTGNISHMHYGDNMDSPVTFISGNRGILPDAEKEVSR